MSKIGLSGVVIEAWPRLLNDATDSLPELLSSSTSAAHSLVVELIAFESLSCTYNVLSVHERLTGLHFHAASREDRQDHDVGIYEIRSKVGSIADDLYVLKLFVFLLESCHVLTHYLHPDVNMRQDLMNEPEDTLVVGLEIAPEEHAKGLLPDDRQMVGLVINCLKGIIECDRYLYHTRQGITLFQCFHIAVVEYDDSIGIRAGKAVVAVGTRDEHLPERKRLGQTSIEIDTFHIVEIDNDLTFVTILPQGFGYQSIDTPVDEHAIERHSFVHYLMKQGGIESEVIAEGHVHHSSDISHERAALLVLVNIERFDIVLSEESAYSLVVA